MSREAWGDEGEGDYGQDRLLDAGWLTDDDAKMISDAARVWIRLRRGIPTRPHNNIAELSAATELEGVLVEVFGEKFLTKEPTR